MRLATLLLVSTLAGGCKSSKHAAPEPVSTAVAPKADDAAKLATTPVEPNRKVIRTGHVDLVVATYDEARGKLDALLASTGGYVDSTQVQHSQGAVSSATLVLRIPQDKFGALVPRLRELGEIAAERTHAEDVTDQFVDVAARLASAKTLEKRLLELAAERGSGVEALLAVERELARVRGEIESYEGRLRQWNDQVATSTLTLAIATRAPAIATASEGLGDRIASGFHGSLAAMQGFFASAAVMLTSLLPWLAFLIPGFVLGRRLFRRYAKQLPVATVVEPK